MIPENIEKLLKSPCWDDVRLGIILLVKLNIDLGDIYKLTRIESARSGNWFYFWYYGECMRTMTDSICSFVARTTLSENYLKNAPYDYIQF